MGRFANRHPTDLTVAVGQAVANGAGPQKVRDQLLAGTFPAWNGPYDMPLETVRYYGKKEKNLRASRTVSNTVRSNPVKAVDDLARLLLSAAERGLQAARPAIDKDPKALKEWGDALKTISALVRDQAQDDKPKRGKPSDPLTAKLTTPPSPSEPSPVVAPEEEEGEADGGKTRAHDTPQPNPHHGGVAARAPETSLNGGGVGSWPGPAASAPFGAGNGTPSP